MAYHVACPLSCRKICYCSFGDSRPRQTALQISTTLAALNSSLRVPFEQDKTIEVVVPSLLKVVKKSKQKIPDGRDGREKLEGRPSAAKKTKIYKGSKVKVPSTTVAETGVTIEPAKKPGVVTKIRVIRQVTESNTVSITPAGSTRLDEHAVAVGPARHGPKFGSSVDDLPRPVCALCSSADIIGKGKEKKMLSCHGCRTKFHRKCVKQLAEFRDLFDWSSWRCSSCRSCEVCRQTGEPNKLMFCKRCDCALHIYCQQPPLKHVPKGPYLCPKHTICHSCGSNVPGSGVSSRWFMAYTTCDACGRLFVKDKYCPVCLKVYRDSEITPMVCCDSCAHWVHCSCDGISDEKFHQFQSDGNLRYECAACRGDCHKVTGIDDAVRELWKRRDQRDAEQRSKLSAAAGVVSQEEALDFGPSSDDDKERQVKKNPGSGRMQAGRTSMEDGGLVGSASDEQEESGRKTMIIQRTNLKGPRRKWIQKSQRRTEPRQKLLSSVTLQY